MKSILDPSFRYTPSVQTDVRKTFARIRRELHEREQSKSKSERDVDGKLTVLAMHRYPLRTSQAARSETSSLSAQSERTATAGSAVSPTHESGFPQPGASAALNRPARERRETG